MIPVKILAVRYLANADPALARSLGAPEGLPSLAMLTTDCDDATYIALDAATVLLFSVALATTCYEGEHFAGMARILGVGFAVFLAWRKMPLIVVIIAAAVVTALLRLAGIN